MKVLLTGGSGFIGKHCLDYLLKHGHSIVTTVRSDAKWKQILDDYPESLRQLSYCIVEDMAHSGAFDQAVQSDPPFEAVLHIANMIDSAIMGTTEILRAIKSQAPSVKRVVVTSSFAAVINPQGHLPVYTADIWNPITMDQALQGGLITYIGSKKFAEKAAWDFVENEKPEFILSTINPVLVFGPVTNYLKSLDNVNTSNTIFRDMMQGKMKSGITASSFFWVDVRDVALAHVRAIEVPEAAGKRFLAAAGPFNNEQIAKVIKDNFPNLADNFPEKIDIPDEPQSYRIDTTPMNQILGIPFRPLDQCVIDTVKSLLKVNA
ncbi:dihydroflavonol-4-reductase [Halenospora varia]|nr:dihydroflavonol-4-reductase [Halenospora varia]